MKPDKFSEIPKWVFEALEEKLGDVSYHDYGCETANEIDSEKFIKVPFVERDDNGFCSEQMMKIRYKSVDFFGTTSILAIVCGKVAPPNITKQFKMSGAEDFKSKFSKQSWAERVREEVESFAFMELVKDREANLSIPKLKVNPVTMTASQDYRTVGIETLLSENPFFKGVLPNYLNLDV